MTMSMARSPQQWVMICRPASLDRRTSSANSSTVHPQAVRVVYVQPEVGAAQEKALHFPPAVVEDEAVPVGVHPLAGVGVLIQVGSVEKAQAPGVGGEVARHPVQDDADAAPVQVID